MEQLVVDLRLAARLLIKSPGFTLVAVLSLALGVGANTTIFSLLNAFLLQPLPGREPARLATVYTSDYSGPLYGGSSYADYRDFRSGSRAFVDLAAYGIKPLLFTQAGESQRILAQLVTGNLFEVVGLNAAYGRMILKAEETPGQHPVLVLSDAFWRSRSAPTRGLWAARWRSTASPTPSSASARPASPASSAASAWTSSCRSRCRARSRATGWSRAAIAACC